MPITNADWRELPEMSIEDLWLIPRSGFHLPFELDIPPFHGGFVPDIPYFLMSRFTEPGWTVYDPMAGMMTTRRVGDKMARDVISVDICDHLPEDDPLGKELVLADARWYNPGPVDMILWHPPYQSIIQFSNDPDDLSNMDNGEFWVAIGECLDTFDACLKPDRVCAIVIGNIYENGAIVPLPLMMESMVAQVCPDWKLKGSVVKDIHGNRQDNQRNFRLSRLVRANAFEFKWEAILVYHKPKGE
jgi:hypothetical protein